MNTDLRKERGIKQNEKVLDVFIVNLKCFYDHDPVDRVGRPAERNCYS